MTTVIRAQGLTRRFGELRAVDGVDFAVESGEVFGFLGPNGAGKTTTVRMLTGVLDPSGGTASIQGHDIRREPLAFAGPRPRKKRFPYHWPRKCVILNRLCGFVFV
jgi:ABC-type multidrug transport system ATPase subunit